MNKRVSPAMIGAFVISALGLLVIAVIAFGSGRLFRHTQDFVLYFPGEVNGLRVGAPVKYKGVEIGSVKEILLRLDPNLQVARIPVIVEIELDKITSAGGSGAVLEDPKVFKSAIEQGLRGQLQTESLVTGLLYVALDLFPDTPVDLVQPPGSRYPEIPTVPTAIAEVQDTATKILAKLEETNFKGLVDSFTKAADGINQLVNSPALKSSLSSLDRTVPKIDRALAGFDKLTRTLDVSFAKLSANLQQTSNATRIAMNQAGSALKQSRVTLQRAEVVLTNIRNLTDPESPTFYDLNRSLKEISSAARSLRLLSNYLERNPRALIFGRPEDKEGR